MRIGTKVTTTTTSGKICGGRVAEPGDVIGIDCGAFYVYAAAGAVTIERETIGDIRAAAIKLAESRVFIDAPDALRSDFSIRSLIHGGRIFGAPTLGAAERRVIRFGIAQLRLAKGAAGIAKNNAAILFPPAPSPVNCFDGLDLELSRRGGATSGDDHGFARAQASYDRRSARGY